MSSIKINFNYLPHQREIYLDDTTKEVALFAGLGSGKTRTLCEKILRLSWLNKGFQGGVLAPSYREYHRDIEPCLIDEVFPAYQLKENRHWFYNRSKLEFRFSWNKKKVYIFTAEKAIAGPNLAYMLINEPSLIPYIRIKEARARVRAKSPYSQIGYFGTPEDRYLWIEEFISKSEELNERKPGSFKKWHANTRQNTYLDDDYYDRLISQYDEKAAKVFTDGQILSLNENSFYYAFSDANISEHAKQVHGDKIYVNMDFNVGRMTATFAHKLGDHTHYFDNVELAGNSDTPQMAQYIRGKYGVNVFLTIDASGKNRKTTGASDYQLLIQAGFPQENIRMKSVNPRLRERQLLVCGRMHHKKILINPCCKILINDLKRVEQNKLTFEKIKDKEGKLTHASDTLDYFEDYEFTIYNDRKTKTIQL